jgi:hypothetical protein
MEITSNHIHHFIIKIKNKYFKSNLFIIDKKWWKTKKTYKSMEYLFNKLKYYDKKLNWNLLLYLCAIVYLFTTYIFNNTCVDK